MFKFIKVVSSYQGEGPFVGRRMLIVRFKSCNMVDMGCACSYCDSRDIMNNYHELDCTADNLNRMITMCNGGILISGGEPLYDTNFNMTINILKNCEFDIANIETNGHNLKKFIIELKKLTKYKRDNAHVIYSPKIPTEFYLEYACELRQDIIRSKNVFVKLVVNSSTYKNTNIYLKHLLANFAESKKVWLIPEGSNIEDQVKNMKLARELSEKYHTSLSGRMHVIYNFD